MQINTNIVAIHVYIFHCLTIPYKEMLLFSELIWTQSVHIDNKEKDILIFGEVPTQRLEAKYSVNFTELNRKFCLGLHYNGSNSFLFANATKI